MTFEEYLTKRRVNVAAFAAGDPVRFAQWQNWFGQMHPESFTLEVKMVLNDVRKKFWLAEVPKPVIAETEAAAASRPAGRRAAIAKPVAPAEPAKPEIQQEETAKPTVELSPEKTAETKPASGDQASSETAAKPARPTFRPRAVIKKPISEIPAEEVPETKNAAEPEPAGNKTEELKQAENPEATPKPARPRAVIKRPAALSVPENKPAENPEIPTPGKPETIAEASSKTVADQAEKVNPEEATETPKPRARPVFKRPVSTGNTSESKTAEPEKTVSDTSKTLGPNSVSETATENPVAKPGQEGASEVKAITEEIQASPEGAKAAEEVAAAAGHMPKQPRPRPVFKRPAAANPPENTSAETPATEPEKTVSETIENPEPKPEEIQPEKAADNSGDSDAKGEESAPKPPRPRLVFKRPAKPEGDNDKPQ